MPLRSRSIWSWPSVMRPLLRGDEAVLHRVRDAHADGQADDARRALQRVRGAHARFELVGCGVDRARAPAGPTSAPAPGSPPPSGTGRASRRWLEIRRRSCRRSGSACETSSSSSSRPTDVAVPRQHGPRVGRGGPGDGRGHFLQFPRMKAVNAVTSSTRAARRERCSRRITSRRPCRRAVDARNRLASLLQAEQHGRATRRPAARRGRSPGRARRRARRCGSE